MQHDQTIVEVVNRTTKPLNVMFDGVPYIVVPGYKMTDKGAVPAGRDGQPKTTPMGKTVAEYARRQNVKLGTEEKDTGEADFLVGVAQRDEMGKITADPHWIMNAISYTEQGNAVERFNRKSMDPRASRGEVEATSGFPRGRQGAADGPFQYADGPVGTQREV
jgi:hypothetical protein